MIEINNLTKAKIPLEKIKKITEKFLLKYKKTNFNISIAFIGDTKMRELNKIYRGFDKTTDILSFEGEEDEEGDLGELIISYQQIKRQAKQFSDNIDEELVFILVHGLFHLLGYNDETEKEKSEMDDLVKEFVKQLKIKN